VVYSDRLCVGGRRRRSLPRNSEVELALREYQRLFQSDSQPVLLLQRREAATRAMDFLRRFDPRLVGAIADGSADAHSPVCLHLHCDEVESVVGFLEESGIPFDQRERRIRLDRERVIECPVLVFSADGVSMDLSVLPHDVLRQAPLDRSSHRPMQRLSLSALRSLMANAEIAENDPSAES
jgi:hypothetical protein